MGGRLLEKSARKFEVERLGPVFTAIASERDVHVEKSVYKNRKGGRREQVEVI